MATEEAKKEAKKRKSRNYILKCGVYRFGRGRMFHKRGLFNISKKAKPEKKEAKKKAPVFVEKQIGGEKNGGTRMVRVKKLPAYYSTVHRPKKLFPAHLRHRKVKPARRNLSPGTVCIVLGGTQKGKRVLYLKQMALSGLCLITGPFKLNRCPLRRIHQHYLIATKTKLDISSVEIPKHLNDKYFRRIKKRRPKKAEGDIFEQKKERYLPSKERKKDQKAVDKQIFSAIRKRSDKKLFRKYLKRMFGLQNKDYPHAMSF